MTLKVIISKRTVVVLAEVAAVVVTFSFQVYRVNIVTAIQMMIRTHFSMYPTIKISRSRKMAPKFMILIRIKIQRLANLSSKFRTIFFAFLSAINQFFSN